MADAARPLILDQAPANPGLPERGLVDPADLVSLTAIARRLGKPRSIVYHWHGNYRGSYPDFPRPVAEDGNWQVFLWSQVRDWVARQESVVSDRPICVEDVLDL